jgi:hypothetical protein
MSKRLAPILVLVLSCAPAVASSVTTGTSPLVALEGSTTVELADAVSPRCARLAVKPSTPKPVGDEQPRVLELSLGNLRNPGLGDALSAVWELAPDRSPLALVVTLKDSVRRPGVYKAILAPLSASIPAERLELQISLAAAKLGLPEKLIVSRTLRWPLCADGFEPDLEVREESRAVRITALTVTRVTSNAGTTPLPVGLNPLPGPFAIAPGRSAHISYRVDPGLPLGSSTGKLRFSAPELADPVVLDYEVRTRLSSGYIPIIIVSGFFLGWLVRKRLATLIRLGQTRTAAARVLSSVDGALSERPDAVFQKALKPVWQKLARACAADDPDAIVAATAALDQELRANLVDFGQRQIAGLTGLDELRALAAPLLPLPKAALALLPPAREASDRARAALDRNDVVGAQAELAAVQGLAKGVHEVALQWQDDLRNLLEGLRRAALGLPAAVVSQFDQRSQSWPAIDVVKAGTTFSTPAERHALFVDFHSEFREARLRLIELAMRLDSEWVLIEQALAPVRARLQPAFDELASSVHRFQTDLEASADDPDALRQTLHEKLKRLADGWRGGLLDQAPEAARANLSALYEGREFLKLASEVTKSLTVQNKMLGGGPAAVLASPEWSAQRVELPEAAPASVAPSVALRAFALPPIPETITVPEATFIRSAILATLYIAVYWMLHADTFGTQMSDTATLLLTSFGLDLGVEGLLQLKK